MNILIEVRKNLKNGSFTNGYFSLDDDGEVDIIRFLKQVMN